MNELNLQNDEVLLLSDKSASLNKDRGELYLTNKRLVFIVVKKPLFGRPSREIRELSLASIKMYNNSPQVTTIGDRLSPKLQIQHTSGIDEIDLHDKRRGALLWLNEIHKAITGEEASEDADKVESFALPGAETVGKALKDSLGAFSAGLGVREARKKGNRISAQCSTCGAPILGYKGEKATCEYCGTTQTLKK